MARVLGFKPRLDGSEPPVLSIRRLPIMAGTRGLAPRLTVSKAAFLL